MRQAGELTISIRCGSPIAIRDQSNAEISPERQVLGLETQESTIALDRFAVVSAIEKDIGKVGVWRTLGEGEDEGVFQRLSSCCQFTGSPSDKTQSHQGAGGGRSDQALP